MLASVAGSVADCGTGVGAVAGPLLLVLIKSAMGTAGVFAGGRIGGLGPARMAEAIRASGIPEQASKRGLNLKNSLQIQPPPATFTSSLSQHAGHAAFDFRPVQRRLPDSHVVQGFDSLAPGVNIGLVDVTGCHGVRVEQRER